MTSTVHKVVQTAHGRVSYVESGSGPARVLLHSLLTDRSAFDTITGELPGRFIALDLPGFGHTDPARPDIDDYADRTAAAVRALEIPPEDVTLIGNGLGAFVALGTAIRHADCLSRLLLVGCGARFPEPAKEGFDRMIQTVRDGGLEAVVPIALRRIYTEDYLVTHPDVAAERADVLRKTDPDAFITACQAIRSLDYSGLAGRVSAPTLIVVGDQDQATPPAMAEELHRLIPDSILKVLPGIAHAPQLQNPETFVEVTGPFLGIA